MGFEIYPEDCGWQPMLVTAHPRDRCGWCTAPARWYRETIGYTVYRCSQCLWKMYDFEVPWPE